MVLVPVTDTGVVAEPEVEIAAPIENTEVVPIISVMFEMPTAVMV